MGIEIIGKLTQKNNGNFKLVDLEDVDYDGTGKNAKQELEKKIEDAKNSATPYDDSAIKADIKTLKDNEVTLVKDETSMEGIKDNEYPTLTTTDKTLIGSINEVNAQFKDIAKKTIIENNKLYLAKSDGTKLDEGTQLPVNSGSSVVTNKFYKTESIGQLYDQPGENKYIAWCPGDLRYDKNLDKYIMLVFCCEKHVGATTQEVYQVVIDSHTYETSKPVKIKMLDNDGSTDITPVKFGCCSYIILNDGTYLMLNSIDKITYKFISTDNGLTWVKQNTITGYSGEPWGMYELSNGRIIISEDLANAGLWYSDDKGNTWTNVKPSGAPGNYNAEGCILELGNNKLMCLARKNMSGQGVSSSGYGDKAIISYSTDNGTTWSAWQESSSISMNASCCTGIVHDGLVEIFANNRWYHRGDYTCTEYTNTGKNGALKHYVATIENALLDNFTDNGIVVYANTPSDNSDTAQDFHSPCLATNGKDILLVYFDRVYPYTLESTNHYFIRGSLDGIDYSVKDNLISNVFSYSSAYIHKLLDIQKAQIITLVNEAILSNTPITPGDSDNPTSYITDGIICNFNFLNESKMDKTNMTITDSINNIVGKFTQGRGNNLVTTFPTITTNHIGNENLRIEPNVLDSYIENSDDFEFSREIVLHFDSKNEILTDMSSLIHFVDNNGGNSPRVYPFSVSAWYEDTSNSMQSLGINSLNLLNTNMPGLYHIVYTCSKEGVLNVYLNGKLVGSATASNFSHWDIKNLKNLSFLCQPKRSYRIYKKALTSDEILNNYKYEKSLII